LNPAGFEGDNKDARRWFQEGLSGEKWIVGRYSGTEIVKAERGDVIVVPPRRPHAFAAARGHRAELLIVIAPGVERFEYFRKRTRIARGEEPPESLGDVQQLYDTYFSESPEWAARRH
jgi:hypothetical protein